MCHPFLLKIYLIDVNFTKSNICSKMKVMQICKEDESQFMEKQTHYTEDSMNVLEGLDAVRNRTVMYIASTDIRCLHDIVFEIIDNAVDEVIAGVGTIIKVTIHKDQSISVEDKGSATPIA